MPLNIVKSRTSDDEKASRAGLESWERFFSESGAYDTKYSYPQDQPS